MRSQAMTDGFRHQIEVWASGKEDQNAESEKCGKKAAAGYP